MSSPYLTDIRGAENRKMFQRYDALVKANGKDGVPLDVSLVRNLQRTLPELVRDECDAVNRRHTLFLDGRLSLEQLANHCDKNGGGISQHFDAVSGPMMAGDEASDSCSAFERESFLARAANVTRLSGLLHDLDGLKIDPRTKRHTYNADALAGTMTGRTSFRGCLFTKCKCLRQLVVKEQRDHVFLAVDAAAMDIGVAAGITEDPALIDLYMNDNPYRSFGERILSTPVGAQLRHLNDQNGVWKRTLLAAGYGISPAALGVLLSTSTQIGQRVLFEHARMFGVYWARVRNIVSAAYRRGYIESRSGWMCHVPTCSNERTWQAWPFQAIGADICRQAYLNLADAGVPVLAALHDGFYFSLPEVEILDAMRLIQAALDAANHKYMPSLRLKWRMIVTKDRLQDGADDPLWLAIKNLPVGVLS